MTQTSIGSIRRRAWRSFLFHSGLSVAVIVLALVPVALLEDRMVSVLSLLGASLVVLSVSVVAAGRFMRQLEAANEKIATLTTHDDLTGLPNRRWFFDRLDEEVDRARRYGNKLSLIMIDIDDFRLVNDTFGHPLGDLALAEVGRLIAANIRTSDIVARYGGEEFAIIIPESDAEKAVQVAEKLRMVVEVNDISMEGPEVKVTVSCGVADLKSVTQGKGGLRDALVLAADHALHRAKENGRNQTMMHVAEHEHQLTLV